MATKEATTRTGAEATPMRWKIGVIAVLAVNAALAYTLWTGDNGIIHYRDMRHKQQTLENRISAVQQENRRLSREIRLLQDNSRYLAYTLRAEGRYVHPDEVLYVFPRQAPDREDAHGQ